MTPNNTAAAMLTDLRQGLPGVTTSDGATSLSALLADYFESRVESVGLAASDTWKRWAGAGAALVMDAIHAHYTPTITALHEETLRLTQQAARAEDLLVRLHNEGIVSEGQVAKATGLHRVEIRRRVDEMTARPRGPAMGEIEYRRRITRDMLRAERGTLFVFGDNMARRGYGGQAKEMRGEPNSIGVPTKWAPDTRPEAYFDDSDIGQVGWVIVDAFLRCRDHIRAGGKVVWPADGIGTGLADLPRRAPGIWLMITGLLEGLGRTETRDGTR